MIEVSVNTDSRIRKFKRITIVKSNKKRGTRAAYKKWVSSTRRIEGFRFLIT